MMLQREEERRSTFTAHKYFGTDVLTLSCQNLVAFFSICPFASYFNLDLGMLGVGKAQLVPL